MNNEISEQTSHEEISRRAEELWRQYGCPQGRDEEIWFEAEKQLRGTRQLQQQPQGAQLPSSGTFGGPQTAGTEAPVAQPETTKSQDAELMKTPATTTAARGKSRKSGGK
jgi:Protein of unknown function (DUF2934)